MQVLIIEDEKKAARNLEKILSEIDDTIHVAAVIESVEQGIKWFGEHASPDLIFSDIQLTDGVSFLIYQQVKIEAPVIFYTAFDEYLMQAFDTNAVSYLLKPVNPEQVERALEKYRNMRKMFRERNGEQPVNTLLSQLDYRYKSALLVNQGEKIIPLKTDDIACFYLDENFLLIITRSNQKYRYSSSLDEMQQQLNSTQFYRANRQFIINREYVTGIERYFTRRLVAKLSVETPEKIIVSKTRSTEFLNWLEGRLVYRT
jgi:two-component system LytT family response regulator